MSTTYIEDLIGRRKDALSVPQRVLDISAPQIDVLNARAAELRRSGADVISLGQALPGFAPPPEALQAAHNAMTKTDTHIYSADAGILPLRTVLASRLLEHYGAHVKAESEIIVTCGANQAFMLALMTILEKGDEVVLPSPYFMNHEMAVRAVGAIPVEAPLNESTGFALRWSEIEPYITSRTKAVVVVSPSNPTGAVCELQELHTTMSELRARGVFLISDETYMHFVYDETFTSALSFLEWRKNVVMVSSFSKCYAMTGWRVGYLIASEEITREAMKIQDAMVICAPVIAQEAALAAVEHAWDYPARFMPELRLRRDFLQQRLKEIQLLEWHPTRGGFFAFVRVHGYDHTDELAMEIIEHAHVVTIPGSYFGNVGKSFLRLSYGSVDMKSLATACDRLGKFFA